MTTERESLFASLRRIALKRFAFLRRRTGDGDYDEEWTPYHEFRARTDPPPWGEGKAE